MPFETIQEDVKSSAEDVMKLGRELVQDFKKVEIWKDTSALNLSCGSVSKVA
jgi:hypothetical protein